MSRQKFDPSKVKTQFGKHFYEGQRLGSHRERLYNQWLRNQNGGTVKGRAAFPKQYGKYFSSGTKFTTRQGHLDSWAKPMTLKGGANSNHNWERVWYRENGVKHRTSSNQRWGANVNQTNSKTGSGVTILHGSKQWVRQIQISLYALRVQSENFRVMVGKRALKVFQNSIKYQQFYSKNGRNWPELSSFTRRMRTLRGTGFHKLKEYERLYKSIQISSSNSGRIETKPVYISKQWQTGKKSKLTQTTIKKVVFAGYHNEGKGHHGPISTHYKKRQFIGHSSYLNPFTDSFMKKMMKLYLFDSVFLVKKS